MNDLMSRLPELADDSLAALRSNAERLAKVGDDRQRSAATAMLPAVLAEIAARDEVKAAARRERLAARKTARKR